MQNIQITPLQSPSNSRDIELAGPDKSENQQQKEFKQNLWESQIESLEEIPSITAMFFLMGKSKTDQAIITLLFMMTFIVTIILPMYVIFFVQKEHNTDWYCPKIGWQFVGAGHGPGKCSIILLILLLKFNLDSEMRQDSKRDIIFCKSLFFSKYTYSVDMFFQRVVRINVFFLTCVLFIQSGTIIDVVLNSLAVTFLTSVDSVCCEAIFSWSMKNYVMFEIELHFKKLNAFLNSNNFVAATHQVNHIREYLGEYPFVNAGQYEADEIKNNKTALAIQCIEQLSDAIQRKNVNDIYEIRRTSAGIMKEPIDQNIEFTVDDFKYLLKHKDCRKKSQIIGCKDHGTAFYILKFMEFLENATVVAILIVTPYCR